MPASACPSRARALTRARVRSLSAEEVLSRTILVYRTCTVIERAWWWEHEEEEARDGRGRARRRGFATLSAVDPGVGETVGRADDQGGVWAEIHVAFAC